jgi:1-acyl-sn-glycerol-3-phosphate acyltransferase
MMGSGEFGLVRFLRSVGRFLKLSAIFVFGAIQLVARRPATPTERAEWLHRFAAGALRSMDIAVRVEGRFPGRGAVISNHTGYLDIIAIAALHPVAFVAKSELANFPLLGWMTTMAGTLYVERGRGGSAVRARSGLQSAAEASLPVVFFPEGTTSNGATVMKFHSGILAQVREAGEPVTAAFVSYRLTEDNGPHISLANDVCFWGDDALLVPHVFRLLAIRGIEVSVRIADSPIAFSADPSNRKLAAAEARAAVMELGGIAEPAPVGLSF